MLYLKVFSRLNYKNIRTRRAQHTFQPPNLRDRRHRTSPPSAVRWGFAMNRAGGKGSAQPCATGPERPADGPLRCGGVPSAQKLIEPASAALRAPAAPRGEASSKGGAPRLFLGVRCQGPFPATHPLPQLFLFGDFSDGSIASPPQAPVLGRAQSPRNGARPRTGAGSTAAQVAGGGAAEGGQVRQSSV